MPRKYVTDEKKNARNTLVYDKRLYSVNVVCTEKKQSS